MEILIVDDEPLARQRLVRMIEKLEEHNIIAEAENADAALIAINEHDPDIVLLDVRMPGKDGLTLAHEISKLDCPPAIIFCTAFDQYALDAFGTEAIGYLLKPIKAEQLQDVLNKAQKLNKVQRAAAQTTPAAENKNSRTHISAKTRRGIELIPLEDVRYFVADHKYVTVFGHIDVPWTFIIGRKFSYTETGGCYRRFVRWPANYLAEFVFRSIGVGFR